MRCDGTTLSRQPEYALTSRNALPGIGYTPCLLLALAVVVLRLIADSFLFSLTFAILGAPEQ